MKNSKGTKLPPNQTRPPLHPLVKFSKNFGQKCRSKNSVLKPSWQRTTLLYSTVVGYPTSPLLLCAFLPNPNRLFSPVLGCSDGGGGVFTPSPSEFDSSPQFSCLRPRHQSGPLCLSAVRLVGWPRIPTVSKKKKSTLLPLSLKASVLRVLPGCSKKKK